MTIARTASVDPATLYNATAELTALGEVIDKQGDQIHQLSADLFDTEDGRALWNGIDALSTSGAPICLATVSRSVDPATVARALEHVGGSGFQYALAQLKESRALRAAHAALEAGIDRVASLARQSQQLPVGRDVQSFLSGLTGDVATAAAGLNEGTRVTTADLVRELLDEMERGDNGAPKGVIPTGFQKLDRILNGGLQPGEMATLAARTSVGKTALALAICRNALKSGRCILYANREMVPGVLRDRLISAEAGFAFRATNGARAYASQSKALTVATAAFKSWRLNIRSDLRTLSGVLGEARMTRPELVVLDHISAFGDGTGRKGASLFEIVTHNSNAARDMAIDLGIPVLVLSQLNRAAEDAEEPGLHHLKQSGSLEEDSRVVLLLSRSEVMSASLQRMDLAVAKNSNGSTNRLSIDFNPESQRFTERLPDIHEEDTRP